MGQDYALPDAPDIARALRTGYPDLRAEPLCARCGDNLGDRAYEIEGEKCCVECFRNHVRSYIHTNPEDVARALDIDVEVLD